MILFVAGSVPPAFANPIVYVFAAVFVLIQVRLLSVPPLFDPSIITLSAPFSIKIPVAEEPVMVGVTPPAGLMVTVLVAVEPTLDTIVIGNVSDE